MQKRSGGGVRDICGGGTHGCALGSYTVAAEARLRRRETIFRRIKEDVTCSCGSLTWTLWSGVRICCVAGIGNALVVW